jgi:hypothetical protein
MTTAPWAILFNAGRYVSLDAVRKELHPWLGQAPVAVPAFPALFADQITRYASIGGQTNPKQLDLILAEMIGHV